jgi:exosome complex RNA-binding protein Csl4
MNVIHSESLEVAKESIKISDMVQTRVINNLNDRLIELEN